MQAALSTFLAFTLLAAPSFAQTPTLPGDAVQMKGSEIGAYLDGKRFATIIYDGEAQIDATVNWDLKKGIVYGDFNMNGTKGKFKNPWIVKGDTSCGEKTAKGAWVCQKVFVSGDTMYEVNKKGKLHAVSKLK